MGCDRHGTRQGNRPSLSEIAEPNGGRAICAAFLHEEVHDSTELLGMQPNGLYQYTYALLLLLQDGFVYLKC